MPRPLRTAPGGFIYHVLNRANGKRRIFHEYGDYRAFERVLAEVQERVPMRVLAWCIMPNHWHLVLWPRQDVELSRYMRLVTVTHAQRVHAHRASAGSGHLYQGRFKSFVVQDDAHFLSVARYVEANAFSAGLVQRAEDWRAGSLWHLYRGGSAEAPVIGAWPMPRPTDWLEFVNRPPPPGETDSLRRCARRGSPYGDEAWVFGVVEELGLQCTLRPRGRPGKQGTPVPFYE